jgi:hypothetical protein
MNKTIRANIGIFGTYNKGTAQYLMKKWNIKLRGITEAERNEIGAVIAVNYLSIEVRDYPAIMTQVEESGYVKPGHDAWQIQRISEEGITFYLVNYSGKSESGDNDLWEEVFILIPMTNIISIHNLSEQFFINQQVDRIEEG